MGKKLLIKLKLERHKNKNLCIFFRIQAKVTSEAEVKQRINFKQPKGASLVYMTQGWVKLMGVNNFFLWREGGGAM